MTRKTSHLATRQLIGLIVVLLPLFFSLWPSWSLNLDKELLFRILAILLAAFFVAHKASSGALRLSFPSFGSPAGIGVAAMLTTLLVAAFHSRARYEALLTFLDVLLAAALLLIATDLLRSGAVRPDYLLWLIVGTGAANAILAIIQSAGLHPIFGVPIEVGELFVPARRSVMGFLGNPVFVAEYMAVCVPLGLALLLRASSILQKTLLGLIIALLVVAVLLTMTRAASASIVLGFGVFLCLLSFVSRGTAGLQSVKTTVAFLFLGVALVYAFFLLRYSPIVERYAEQGSFDKRLSMWANTIEMIRERPLLGWGLGSFKLLYFDRQAQRNLERMQARPPQRIRVAPRSALAHAHSEYLQLAQECGAVGLLSFIFLVAAIFLQPLLRLRGAILGDRDPPPAGSIILVVGGLTSVFVLLLTALTSFPWHIAPTAVVAILGAALALALSGRITQTSLAGPSRRWVRVVVFAVVMAAGSVAIGCGMLRFAALCHWRTAERFRSAAALAPALKEYKLASRLCPNDGKITYHLALCYSTMGRYAKAERLYRQAAQSYASPALAVSAAENALRLGHSYEAIWGYTQALAYTQLDKFRRRLSQVYAHLASGFIEEKRFDVALGCLGEALRLHASLGNLKLMARLQQTRGTIDDAIGTLRRIIKMDPFEIGSAFELGQLLERKGMLPEARDAFEAVRRLDPSFRGVTKRICDITARMLERPNVPVREKALDYYLIGKLALASHQLDDAARMFARAHSVAPTLPQPPLFLGRCLQAQGRLSAAWEQYKAALGADPTLLEPLVYLLKTYRKEGAIEGIKWVRERLVSQQPEYPFRKVIHGHQGTPVPTYDVANPPTEVFVGVSIDEISLEYEDLTGLTTFWEMSAVRGPYQDEPELFEYPDASLLRFGRKCVVVCRVDNLVKAPGGFAYLQGATPTVSPGLHGWPPPGPKSVLLKSTKELIRATCISEKIPILPEKTYLLFYKVWSSAHAAYMGRIFFDQSGKALFFNRFGYPKAARQWDWFLDCFVPPANARYLALFLTLEEPSSAAYFDQILLACIKRPDQLRGLPGKRKPPE